MTRRWMRWWPAAVLVAVLAGGSSVGIAAATGAFSSAVTSPDGRCSAPALAGTVVDVELTDRGGPMWGGPGAGPGGPMAQNGPMAQSGPMAQNGWGPGGWAAGDGRGAMMRILLARPGVPAGTVSLRVANTGSLVHELVVLPLAPGAGVGQRAVGSDGRVSEAGALGEASNTCGAGAGDGIEPGAMSWVTLHLAPGRYELVCNLPGHYAAGMEAELRVT